MPLTGMLSVKRITLLVQDKVLGKIHWQVLQVHENLLRTLIT